MACRKAIGSKTRNCWISFLVFSKVVAAFLPSGSGRATCCPPARSSPPSMPMMTRADETSVNGAPKKHIVLIGGGHAHVQVIKALHRNARGEHVAVTLIDALPFACYSGMVPGCVVGSYDPHEALIDLKSLAKWSSIDFVQDRVVDIDFESKRVIVAQSEASIPFDVVSIDIGSVSRDLDAVPGAKKHSIPTRPIHKLVGRIDRAMRDYQENQREHEGSAVAPHIVVVGGGIAGIELAMSVTTRWQELFPDATCTLLNAGSELVPNESASARHQLEAILQDRRIRVRHGATVKEVRSDSVILDGTDEVIPHSVCLWATGAGANHLAKQLSMTVKRGLEATEHGWLKVHPTLQSTNYPFVFCAGDCSSIQGLERGPPPKAGVYAVRAGPVLIENLMAYLSDQPLTQYNPQDDFWKLLVCGKENAIGFRFGLAIQGPWVWQLKDHIDRQFMQLFDVSRLPPPSESSLDKSQYDNVDDILADLPLNPSDDAKLIRRTDDGVDYMKAWAVLRVMARDKEYRDRILETIKEEKEMYIV